MVRGMEENHIARTKHILDTLNSLSWFAMDASWMLQVQEVSLVMILPTFLSGLILCFMEKKKPLTLINIAILNWICMNVSWMFSEIFSDGLYLTFAKSFLGTGLFFIGLAVYFSRNLSETFSHFKRFRLKKLMQE